MNDLSDLGQHMEAVAKTLFGEPAQKTKTELRWGSNGSLRVDLKAGAFYDFSSEEGGGVLDLLKREKGLSKGDALEWLEQHGFIGPRPNDKGKGKRRPRQEMPANDAPPPFEDAPPPFDDSVPFDFDDGAEPQIPKETYREAMSRAAKAGPTKIYDYVDIDGNTICQTCRYEFDFNGKKTKTFRQRRAPNSDDSDKDIARDGWVYNLGGLEQVPYRLPEILAAIDAKEVVFIVEGEKDADNLSNLGLPATCNAMGAGKWPDALNKFFVGANVVIIPDNDPQSTHPKTREKQFHPDGRPKRTGQDHAQMVGSRLQGIAAQVRILDLPGLPLKGDVTDFIELGNGVDEIFEAIDLYARPYQPIVERRFGRVSFGEILGRGVKPLDYIIDDWQIAGEQSFIAGEPGSGKSFLATHAALCIATGKEFLGRKVLKPGLVIYQAGESGTGVMDTRIPAWIDYYGSGLGTNVPFVILPSKVNLFDPTVNYEAFLDAIQNIMKEYPDQPLRTVFIDTLSKSMPGANENDGRDISKVLENLQKISTQTGAHTCVIHHFPKGGKDMRGHGSLKGDVDSVVLVTEDKETKVRTMTFDKVKDGPSGTKIQFELLSRPIGIRSDGKEITSCVVLPVGEKQLAQRSQGFRPVEMEKLAFQALLNALSEAGRPAPAELALPKDVRVVDFGVWKSEFARRAPFVEEDPEIFLTLVNRAIAKAGKKLLEGRVIARDNNIEGRPIWWTGKAVHGFPQTYKRVESENPARSLPLDNIPPATEAELQAIDYGSL